MALSVPDAAFIALAAEILLYGMYTCLFAGSSYLLIFKRKKSKVIVSMIILNIIMWSVSTAHAAVSFDEKFLGFLRENGAQNPLVFENNAAPRVLAQLSLECINFLFGDGIILWRAWVLWKCDRRILCESLAAQFCKQNSILAFLIESGMLYCCTWFAAIFAFVFSSNGIYIMLGMLAQLTAIYPTLIITLVCARATLDVAIETFEQTWRSHRFAAASGPRRSRSIPMHTTSLRVGMETRTYISNNDIEYFAVNASALKDDKDQPAGMLPGPTGIRTSETNSTASSVNVDLEEPCSGSSAQA
ncbi:hypothetical protein DFS33DRAFT_1273640 [Desarmillaria ectypa]|nr:hypothetical protein DFS33DRAFT_1273640 [Desarmillaria ectypa]